MGGVDGGSAGEGRKEGLVSGMRVERGGVEVSIIKDLLERLV